MTRVKNALALLSFLILVAPAGALDLLRLVGEGGSVEATVAPQRGAELTSLRTRFREQWIELLWRANDFSATDGWSGRAPILWPAVGRNFALGVKPNDEAVGTSWKLGANLLPMPIHGFARNLPWDLMESAANRAVLRLRDSPQTREFYPFGFTFDIEYRVFEGHVEIEHTIRAAADNTQPMPFSIGNHITFRVPFVAGSEPLTMTFSTPSTVEYLKGPGSIPNGETRPRSMAIPIALGDLDAFPSSVSLGGYAEEPWARLTDPAGLSVTLRHRASSLPQEPFVMFNLWGNPREGYFSPEPWIGIQNSLNLDGGTIRLDPGTNWTWLLFIEITTGNHSDPPVCRSNHRQAHVNCV